MNNSPIDHLLHLTVPRREVAPTSGRARRDAHQFDSVFRQPEKPATTLAPAPFTPGQPQSAMSDRPVKELPKPSVATPAESAKTDANLEQHTETAATSTDEERDVEEQEVAEAVVAAPAAKQVADPAIELAVEVDEAPVVEKAAAAPNDAEATPRPAVSAAEGESTEEVESAPETAVAAATKKVVADDMQSAGGAAAANVASSTVEDVPTSESASAKAAAAEEPKPASRTTAKSERVTDSTSDTTPVVEATAAQTDSLVESVESTDLPTNEGVEPRAIDTSESERPRLAPRIKFTSDDQPAPSQEPATAPNRSAAAQPAPTAVANIQSPTQADATKATTITTKPTIDAIAAKEGPLSPFARLERTGTNNTQSSHRAGESQNAPRVDPARFVSRVARAIHTAQERGGPLQLRLSPPELGAMRIELSVNQGALTASIETENSAARQVLLENLPTLRERLAEQNVKIERFDVDIRRDGSGQQNPAPQQHGDQQHHEHATHRAHTARGTTLQTPSEEPAPLRRSITASSINVIA